MIRNSNNFHFVTIKLFRMSFYNKYIKTGRKGFSLRGGPFAKWRFPLNKVLYRKKLAAGPESDRPRSIWSNW